MRTHRNYLNRLFNVRSIKQLKDPALLERYFSRRPMARVKDSSGGDVVSRDGLVERGLIIGDLRREIDRGGVGLTLVPEIMKRVIPERCGPIAMRIGCKRRVRFDSLLDSW